MKRLVLVFVLLSGPRLLQAQPADAAIAPHASRVTPHSPGSLAQAVASEEDLWTEAALRQPDGPSLEFFGQLLPPLHYVNADFRHYPIVLSAPNAPKKGRLVSNGSAVNARGNTRAWNELGTPVLFRVGNDELAFGEYLRQLDGPKLAEGYLPIVQLTYHHGGGHYAQETFVSTDPLFASNAVVFTRFTFRAGQVERGDKGRMVVRLDTPEPLRAEPGRILDARGEVLLWFDQSWKWVPGRRILEASFTNGVQATVAAATIPVSGSTASPLTAGGFETQRRQCAQTWQDLLRHGMNLEVPEPYVNNAWRALVLANFALINGDRIQYSAGNQYDKLYEHEGSAAAQALMRYGYESDMRRLLVPLLDFTRQGLEFHQAGHKLDDICCYYWQTRDAAFVQSLRSRWQQEVDRLASQRSATNGLYPREQYCGDIATPVFSMNSNAKGWRALRDTAAVLAALGDQAEAERLRAIATQFRTDILAAVERSVTADERKRFFASECRASNTGDAGILSPTLCSKGGEGASGSRSGAAALFVPNALLGEEAPYDVTTATKMGSYWNLMANCILGSEIFGPGSDPETGLMRYFQQHGGLFMGLVRSRPWPSFWVGTANLNPLYGWYYVRTLLRRDEPDRALASFYGMLAAGLTPDTFTGGEGCSIEPLDEWGRQYYCPPNSAGNAFWLEMLRSLLVQDWDLDQDGQPDTLRLLFATPKRWLADGQAIKLERAPTAFGPVSLRVQSRLTQGEVVAEVELPQRNQPKQTLLRIRVPDGWRVTSAQAGAQPLKVDACGTTDLSSLRGKVVIRYQTERS